MNDLEQKLKDMIVSQYGSMKKFCETINMPWTTLDSILKRGVANSNISNVLKITLVLEINSLLRAVCVWMLPSFYPYNLCNDKNIHS